MRVASLFAGIGGFDLALTRLGHEIVYVNEWDKYAAQTYEKNFEKSRQSKQMGGRFNSSDFTGDESDEQRTKSHRVDTRSITDVPTTDIPDHDLLVGGFPCQAFSIAGKRRGFEDTRGTLFFEIARILKDKRPSYLLLENVKGLLSHDNGRTFETIMRTLDELGYDTQWQVLNSKNFGVPQNRERVFIVGHIRGISRPKIFPFRESGGRDNKTQGKSQSEGERIWGNNISSTVNTRFGSTARGQQLVSNTLAQRDYKGGNNLIQLNNPIHSNNRLYGINGLAPTLNTAQGGNRQPKIMLDRIRRLTPVECERLQGFPDGWTIGSDTQRYKQLGNAVTVNVVYEIAKGFN